MSIPFTSDMYNAIKERPAAANLFAQAFGVGTEVITAEVEAFAKKMAAAEAAKKREAALKAKREALAAFAKESVLGYTMPKTLFSLVLAIEAKAAELSQDGDEVEAWLDFDIGEDGAVTPVLRSSLDTQERASGARGSFDYSHKGVKVEGSLTGFVQENYPDSQAAKRLREKKKGLNAWQAIQADGAIKASFTRQPRNQG